MEIIRRNKKTNTSSRLMKRAFMSMVLLVGLIVTILIGAYTYELIAAKREAKNYPPLGQLVDAGGYNLHILQQGSGSPTILFEGGSGAPSTYWKEITSSLPPNVNVVTYDRAGYNWSDKHVTKRTGENIVTELHTALQNSDINGPYILVGHSIGGMYTRLFAEKYEAEVVGMLLLDARSEHFSDRTNKILENAGVDPQQFGSPSTNLLKFLKASGLLRIFKEPLLGDYYETERELNEAINVTLTSKYYEAIQDETLEEQGLEQALKKTSMGNIPLTVISKGKDADLTVFGLSKEEGKLFEEIWYDEQKKLSNLSTDSKFLIAKNSGHEIAKDEPELVVHEIKELIKRVDD
ncbi:alpha/beta hydrolase [Peribacillus asahii]|uniref:alpha/beta hydrolase n=1 Tax=Peribacillus asahii TaxID=228899 RepID=UPI0038190644